MIKTHPFAQSVLAFALVVVLETESTSTTITTSSNAMLLSPRIRVGQSYAWTGRIARRNVASSDHGPLEYFSTHTVVYTCLVRSQDKDKFNISRRLKVFVNQKRIADSTRTLVFEQHAQWKLDKPSIMIGNGYEYHSDGTPLRDDPICMFYSVPMYGRPPKTLEIGTSWHFDRAGFSRWCKPCTGTATVTSLDNSRRTVTLRVKTVAPGDRGFNPLLSDMVVADGGVIVSQTDRGEFTTVSAIPKEIGTPNSISVWSLQRH